MKRDFYVMENGRLELLVGLVHLEDGNKAKNAAFLTAEEAASLGAYVRNDSVPEVEDGKYVEWKGWKLEEGEWRVDYEIKDIEYTQDDYDREMEAFLLSERSARGYTTREPSMYANSSNARWKQDAADWTAHVDEVMEYGLSVVNAAQRGETVPTLKEFIAGMPRIEWTFKI